MMCYDRAGIWSLKGQICRSTYTDSPLPDNTICNLTLIVQWQPLIRPYLIMSQNQNRRQTGVQWPILDQNIYFFAKLDRYSRGAGRVFMGQINSHSSAYNLLIIKGLYGALTNPSPILSAHISNNIAWTSTLVSYESPMVFTIWECHWIWNMDLGMG